MQNTSQNSAALGEIDHGKLQTQLQSDRFSRQLKLGLGLGCVLILYFAALPLFA